MKDGEVVKIRFQHSAFAGSPVRVQGALTHLGHRHEGDDQLTPAQDIDVTWREFRMPLENKAGDVRINDESCRCDRRRGQYGAAHRCGGRTPQTPPADLDRHGLRVDPARTYLYGSG